MRSGLNQDEGGSSCCISDSECLYFCNFKYSMYIFFVLYLILYENVRISYLILLRGIILLCIFVCLNKRVSFKKVPVYHSGKLKAYHVIKTGSDDLI